MKLSVITICYNEVNGIKNTIESVINQKFRDFEFLVIDGNSTDGTREIVERYKDKIAVFISEKDRGIYSAMNKGLSLARGEYIIFLNGGDYFYNVNVLAHVFKEEIKAPIIYGYCETRTSINTPTLFRAPANLTKRHLIKTSLPHQATFIKRELFLRFGNFDETYKIAGDYDLLLRLVIKNSVNAQYVPVLCSYFDRNGISSTSSQLRDYEKEKARSMSFSRFDLMVYPVLNGIINMLRTIRRAVKKLV